MKNQIGIVVGVNGSFVMTNIKRIENGSLIDRATEKEIKAKLAKGVYLLGSDTRTISHIDQLNKPLFSYETEVGDDTEYDFNVADEEEE